MNNCMMLCDFRYFNMADNMQHMLNKSDNSKLSKNNNSYKDTVYTIPLYFWHIGIKILY